MNMHAQPQRTRAEAALAEAFAARVGELPGDGAVVLARDRAMEQLKAGLPTRRVEAWHYTDLRQLLTSVPERDAAAHAESIAPLVAGSTVLTVLDGAAEGKDPAIDGVTMSRVSDRLADGTMAKALAPQDGDDAVGAFNAAFVTDGWFLDIADGTAPERPIELQHVHGAGQAHVRLPVRVGAGVTATVVQRETGAGPALVSSVSNLTIGEGSHVIWVIVQEQPEAVTHLGQFNAWIGKDAKLTLFVMNTGGKLVRQEIRVGTTGEGADFTLRGVNLLAGDTHTDVTMTLDHAVPMTSSTEIVRNVAMGRAQGVFQGRINVHQAAQKTDARMACNTLLLSDEAAFFTKPELEIFADDVQCGHGATVTEIDAGHLFYLMARGIDEKTARGLLVKAFVAEVIEDLEDEALVEALEAKLEGWFAAHG
jgi:Fe-S cluster assembly protein SufD